MSDDAIDATAHGAGENFPLDDTGEELDAAPADNKRDTIDRRVELFFFDAEFGITPPPPGPNSKAGSSQYPVWRKRVAEVIELRADDLDGPKVTFIEMADAHFRTNSAVALPEGEDPDKTGAHQALTSVGVIATALRFNEEHPGRTLLVAGHADSTNTPAFNQPLSEERAQLTLALLEGGDSSRETFKKLAQGRHTVADIKQILSWAAGALPGFDCAPGTIDDNLGTATGPIRNFQNSYNAQRATIAPSSPSLTPDGSVGLLTWGAFFDCYEFALQQELGEDAAGLAVLRGKLVFVDPSHKSLGFSEYFPIEELGVDNFRSQSNRRVEILFFEQGEEPDIQHAVDDPETSDLYLPGHYERGPLPLRANGLFGPLLEISVFVGNGNESDPDGELLVLNQVGTLVQAIPGKAADEASNGYCVFHLPTGTLPDPCELRWQTSLGTFVLAGPCAPVELRDAVDNDQPQAAAELALAGPAESPPNQAVAVAVAETGPGDPTSVVV